MILKNIKADINYRDSSGILSSVNKKLKVSGLFGEIIVKRFSTVSTEKPLTVSYSTVKEEKKFWVSTTNQYIEYCRKQLFNSCNKNELLIDLVNKIPLLPNYKSFKKNATLLEKEKQLELNFIKQSSNGIEFVPTFGFKFEYFPLIIRELLKKITIDCLYYQNVSHVVYMSDEVFLYLNPFFQKIHNAIFTSEKFKEAYVSFKVNKILLNESNLSKRKIKTEIKKFEKAPTKMLIQEVLASFILEGYKLKKVGNYNPQKKIKVYSHVICFSNITKMDLAQAVINLSAKPMVCQPNEWELDDKKNIVNGGYLLNKEHGTPIYFNSDIDLKSNLTFDIDYCKLINELQKQPYTLSLELIEFSFKNWMDYYVEVCREEIHNCLGSRKSEGSITLRKINLLKNKLNRLIMFITEFQNLVFLCSFEDFSSGFLTIFFPIHIDRIGRMYNWGSFNIVNSKFFRHSLVNLNMNKKLYDHSINDLKVKILERISKINSNKTGEVDIVFLRHYEKLLIDSANKYIFLDATSSMLQIYSLLFADINIAVSTNLSTEGFDPVKHIAGNWAATEEELVSFKNWKYLVSDRFFLKWIILYCLYGASYLKIKEYIQLKMQEKDPLNYSKGYSGLTFAIKWALKNVKKTFVKLFEIKVKFNKKKIDKIALNWQRNKVEYSYFKKSDLTLDISKVYRMQQNCDASEDSETKKRNRLELSWNTYSVVDKQANVRTIFTGILHSLDAAVALTTRVEMLKKYGVNVYSIHDCFAVPIEYCSILKKEYKDALFRCVFDARLIDILKIEGIDLTPIQDEVDTLKTNKEWETLRNSYSDFCLKVE